MEKKLFVLILLIIGWPSVCWASQGGFRICFKEMTPTTEVADVVTLGRSSHVLLSRGSPFRCVAYALRKSREALSVREIVKVAVDGALRAWTPRGPRLSVMIPTTVAEVAFTNGFSIVPRSQFLAPVQEITHVIEILQETTFFSSTPAKACVTDIFRTTVWKANGHIYFGSKGQFSLAHFRPFED